MHTQHTRVDTSMHNAWMHRYRASSLASDFDLDSYLDPGSERAGSCTMRLGQVAYREYALCPTQVQWLTHTLHARAHACVRAAAHMRARARMRGCARMRARCVHACVPACRPAGMRACVLYGRCHAPAHACMLVSSWKWPRLPQGRAPWQVAGLCVRRVRVGQVRAHARVHVVCACACACVLACAWECE